MGNIMAGKETKHGDTMLGVTAFTLNLYGEPMRGFTVIASLHAGRGKGTFDSLCVNYWAHITLTFVYTTCAIFSSETDSLRRGIALSLLQHGLDAVI